MNRCHELSDRALLLLLTVRPLMMAHPRRTVVAAGAAARRRPRRRRLPLQRSVRQLSGRGSYECASALRAHAAWRVLRMKRRISSARSARSFRSTSGKRRFKKHGSLHLHVSHWSTLPALHYTHAGRRQPPQCQPHASLPTATASMQETLLSVGRRQLDMGEGLRVDCEQSAWLSSLATTRSCLTSRSENRHCSRYGHKRRPVRLLALLSESVALSCHVAITGDSSFQL